MSALPQSDQLIEDVYNLVNRQQGERNRADVARIALLAAQYRANQLKQARMQQANERRLAARRELLASTGVGLVSSSAVNIADPAGRLSPVQPGAEGEAQ